MYSLYQYIIATANTNSSALLCCEMKIQWVLGDCPWGYAIYTRKQANICGPLRKVVGPDRYAGSGILRDSAIGTILQHLVKG